MKFESIEQFKTAAQFFPSGRIIPQRVLKGTRKTGYWFTFGCDTWILPTPTGYVCAGMLSETYGGSLVRIDSRRPRGINLRFIVGPQKRKRYQVKEVSHNVCGSAYTIGGETSFIGDLQGGGPSQLDEINLKVQARLPIPLLPPLSLSGALARAR